MKEAEVILKMTREEFLSDCHYFSDKYKKQLEQDTARANELKKEIRTIIYKSRVG